MTVYSEAAMTIDAADMGDFGLWHEVEDTCLMMSRIFIDMMRSKMLVDNFAQGQPAGFRNVRENEDRLRHLVPAPFPDIMTINEPIRNIWQTEKFASARCLDSCA